MRNTLVKTILTLAHKKKEGHIGSSLSILDILYVLYDKFIYKKENRFVLSKGHASLGLFVVLDHFGLLGSPLDSFCDFDSPYGGHPCNKVTAVETSTGSLGHGLPIAVGMAMGNKINGSKGKVYVLIGDGEANEGSIWESALLASHHKLNNLVCFMDHNHSGDRALDLDDVKAKFKTFGWHTIDIDGHSHEDIYKAAAHKTKEKPIFILAKTIKGKGIKAMENNPEWHHKSPTEEELKAFLKELKK
jgi:transketolase